VGLRSLPQPSQARPGRETLVPPTRLAPLGPASRFELPPAADSLELQPVADRSDRVVGEAVLGESNADITRVLEPEGLGADRRGQRSGILQPHELDRGPNRRARQIRIP